MPANIVYYVHLLIISSGGRVYHRGMHAENPRSPQWWLVLWFWLLFSAGVAVHLLAPNLERKDKAFVIPSELASSQNTFRPDLIVAKERRMQVISALLTMSGALGLGFLYRGVLLPRGWAAGTGARRGVARGDLAGRGLPQK